MRKIKVTRTLEPSICKIGRTREGYISATGPEGNGFAFPDPNQALECGTALMQFAFHDMLGRDDALTLCRRMGAAEVMYRALRDILEMLERPVSADDVDPGEYERLFRAARDAINRADGAKSEL